MPDPTPPAELRIGTLEVAPGSPVTGFCYLTNPTEQPREFTLAVEGFAPAGDAGAVEVTVAGRVGPVAPQSTVSVPIRVLVPAGYPPCTLVGAVRAEAVGGDGTPASRSTTGTLRVVIADGAAVLATLEPAEVQGAYGAKLDLVLRNRGKTPLRVELSPIQPDPGVDIAFADRSPVLEAGREVRIRTRLRAARPIAGGEQRRPFGIEVRGRSTPVVLEGTLVQRPLLASWLIRGVALALVMALWVAVAVVGITDLGRRVHHDAAARAAATQPTIPPAGGPSARAAGAGGAGGSSAGIPGASGGGAEGILATSNPATTDRVAGTVNGPSQLAGIQVTIQPTSLASTATQGAKLVGATRAASGGVVFGNAIPLGDAALTAAVTGTASETVTTRADGTWVFPAVRAPGIYLVSFAKAGYTERKDVITLTAPDQTFQLAATLVPATGAIGGTVVGPGGAPLGNAVVSVTDGTITITSRTPSSGPGKGTFQVGGLTTPGHYLVSATFPGLATETQVVSLGPSQSGAPIRLRLLSGVGTVTGTAVDDTGAGVGDLAVRAVGGGQTFTTVTATGPAGVFTLPNLPTGLKYTLTVSGSGYEPLSESFALTGNKDLGKLAVGSSTATVTGMVRANGVGGLPGAGVILSNQTTTLKTLTQSVGGSSTGAFNFEGVAPGSYVLTVEDYGYATAEVPVQVSAGEATRLATVTLAPQPAASIDTGTLEGSVYSLFDNKAIPGMTVELDGNPHLRQVTDAAGNYKFQDLAPGVHTVEAIPTAAQEYEVLSEQVDVTFAGTVFAPPLELPSLDSLTGTVTSGATKNPIPGATVTIASLAGGPGGSASGTTGTPTTTAAVGSTGSSTCSTATPAVTTTNGTSVSTTGSTTTCTDGGYGFTRLPHGNYLLTVKAPGYDTSTQEVTLQLDENALHSVVLTMVPEFNVVVYKTAAGATTQVGGVCVTVTNDSGTPSFSETLLSSASAPITFPPVGSSGPSLVANGTYTATFWDPTGTAASGTVAGAPPAPCPAGEAEYATAPPVTFTAGYDNTGVTSVYLTPLPPGIDVTLTFPYFVCNPAQDGGACPPGATSTTETCPVQRDAPASGVTGEAGCPALDATAVPKVTVTGQVHTATGDQASPPISLTPVGNGSDVWTVPASTIAAASLTGNTVTLQVSGGAFTTSTQVVTLQEPPGTTPQAIPVTLAPQPVAVNGSFVVKGSTAESVTTANVTVDPSSVTPPGSSSQPVTVADSGGALTWPDALPGIYVLHVSDAGYSPTTATVVIGGCGGRVGTLCASGSPPPVQIALQPLETLQVDLPAGPLPSSAVNVYLAYDRTASPGAGNPVPQPTLASPANGGGVSAVDLTSGVSSPSAELIGASAGDQVDFTYLSQTSGAYQVIIAAPGFQTWFSPLLAFTPGTATVSPTSMVQEGTVTGTVQSVLGPSTSPFGGAYVAAAPATTCKEPANLPGAGFAAAGTVTTTAASDGTFVLGASSAVTVTSGGLLTGNADGGLCTQAGGSGSAQYQFVAAAAPVVSSGGQWLCQAGAHENAGYCDNFAIAATAATAVLPGRQPFPATGPNAGAGDANLTAQTVEQTFHICPANPTTGSGTDTTCSATATTGFPLGIAFSLAFTAAGITFPSNGSGSAPGAADCATTNPASVNNSIGCSITEEFTPGNTAISEIVVTLPVYPTAYVFDFNASSQQLADYEPLQLSQISYAALNNDQQPPPPIQVGLSGTNNVLHGTVEQPSTASSCTWPPATVTAACGGLGGITVELVNTAQSGTVLARTTTAADGSYSFGGLLDGDYEVVVTGSGVVTQSYDQPGSPPTGTAQPIVVEGNSSVVEDVEVQSTLVDLAVTVSTPTGVDPAVLAGVGATLVGQSAGAVTGATVPSSCPGNTPAAGAAAGLSYTGTVNAPASGSGVLASFSAIEPGYYLLQLTGGTALPTPTPTDTNPADLTPTLLLVCAGSGGTPDTASITAAVAQVQGTLTLQAPKGVTPASVLAGSSVAVEVTASGYQQAAAQLTAVSGTTTSGGTGTWDYTAWVPAGVGWTVAATPPPSGWSTATTSGTGTCAAGGCTAPDIAVTPDPGSLVVTINAPSGVNVSDVGLQVTSSGSSLNLSTSDATQNGDQFTFTGIPADESAAAYTVAATYDGNRDAATFSVAPGQQAAVTLTATPYEGTLKLSAAPASNVDVTLTFCMDSACNTTVDSPVTETIASGTTSTTFALPLATTPAYVKVQAAGYSTPSTPQAFSDLTSSAGITLSP